MITYTMPIDPHVHLRGQEYLQHDFLRSGIEDAELVGLAGLLEQPNCQPWITTIEEAEKRADKFQANCQEKEIGCAYRVHIGLTTDLEQVENALRTIMQGSSLVVSDKTFYVHSTGNMGILDSEVQREIWKLKGRIGYKGVSIGHFEDESYFTGEFDPELPITHSVRQNEESETVQLENQLRNARDAGFQGIFYVAHVSSPETIKCVLRERPKLSFELVLEITWHHMFLNTLDYNLHENRVKVNPPLRKEKSQEKLLEHVLRGDVQVIGSDHAPHPIEKKDDPESPASGIPALPFWPKGIELLRKNNIKDELLQKITFNNANQIFKLNLFPKQISKEYDPTAWEKYVYNPFLRLG